METAVVYSNLGSIQRVLKKYKDAVSSFSEAIRIRQEIQPEKLINLIPLYESVAFCNSEQGNVKEGDRNFQIALDLAEKTNSLNSKGGFYLTLGSARNAAKLNDFDRSFDLYKRAKALSFLHFEIDSLERVELMESYACNFLAAAPRQEQIEEFRALGTRLKDEETKRSGGRVEHGKALRLAAPRYPPTARSSRLYGEVYVRIRIDSEGKVVSAKWICSNPFLGQSAAAAAMKAVFSPTIKNGIPIEIEGLITYKFELPR